MKMDKGAMLPDSQQGRVVGTRGSAEGRCKPGPAIDSYISTFFENAVTFSLTPGIFLIFPEMPAFGIKREAYFIAE